MGNDMKRFWINGGVYTLDEMLSANADSPDACEWLNNANVGDKFLDGEPVVCVPDDYMPNDQN